MPGTEMKVTSEMGAVIIAKATIGHGMFLLPLKNVELLAPFPVKWEISNRTTIYAAIIKKIRMEREKSIENVI